jgi:hypothetical protein
LGKIQQDDEKPVFVVFAVIPAKAGIQSLRALLDSRLRGSDDRMAFFSNLLQAGYVINCCPAGDEVAIFHPQIQKGDFVGGADAVVDAVLDDGHVKVTADGIHAGGAHTAARSAAYHDEGVHFELDEDTEQGSPIESAGIALVDHNVPFLGSDRFDNRRALGSFQVLGGATNRFCRKPVKGNALLDLTRVNDGPFLFPERADEGFEPFYGSPSRFADTGGPLLDLLEDGFVSTRIVVLGINDEQRRAFAKTTRFAIPPAADDLAVGRSKDVVPNVFRSHYPPPLTPPTRGGEIAAAPSRERT